MAGGHSVKDSAQKCTIRYMLAGKTFLVTKTAP